MEDCAKMHAARNDEFMRVFGLPLNDTVYELDPNALYGFSININGTGWNSDVCSWDSAFGTWSGAELYAKVTNGDASISVAFFELNDNQQPKAVISSMGMPAIDRPYYTRSAIYRDLTFLADDVEPLEFEI